MMNRRALLLFAAAAAVAPAMPSSRAAKLAQAFRDREMRIVFYWNGMPVRSRNYLGSSFDGLSIAGREARVGETYTVGRARNA